MDFFDFVVFPFVLCVVLVAALIFGMAWTSNTMSRKTCNSYAELTNTQTKFVEWGGCYTRTATGWRPVDNSASVEVQ